VLAGLTLNVPAEASVPVQPPLAVQEVAFVLDQVNVELLPAAIDVGLADRVTVGAGVAVNSWTRKVVNGESREISLMVMVPLPLASPTTIGFDVLSSTSNIPLRDMLDEPFSAHHARLDELPSDES
jgi:hypothetical protein